MNTLRGILNFLLLMAAFIIVPAVLVGAGHLTWRTHQYLLNLNVSKSVVMPDDKPRSPASKLAAECLESSQEELHQASLEKESASLDKASRDLKKEAKVIDHKTTDYISRVLLADTEARDAAGKVIEILPSKTAVRYFPFVDAKKFGGDTRNWVAIVKAPFSDSEVRYLPAESVVNEEVDAKTMQWEQIGKSQWKILAVPGKATPIQSFTPPNNSWIDFGWGGNVSVSINGGEWRVLRRDEKLPRMTGQTYVQFLLAPEEPIARAVVVTIMDKKPETA